MLWWPGAAAGEGAAPGAGRWGSVMAGGGGPWRRERTAVGGPWRRTRSLSDSLPRLPWTPPAGEGELSQRQQGRGGPRGWAGTGAAPSSPREELRAAPPPQGWEAGAGTAATPPSRRQSGAKTQGVGARLGWRSGRSRTGTFSLGGEGAAGGPFRPRAAAPAHSADAPCAALRSAAQAPRARRWDGGPGASGRAARRGGAWTGR